jgi:hypothetical protein
MNGSPRIRIVNGGAATKSGSIDGPHCLLLDARRGLLVFANGLHLPQTHSQADFDVRLLRAAKIVSNFIEPAISGRFAPTLIRIQGRRLTAEALWAPRKPL